MLLLLLFLMHRRGYLVSTVTMVTSLLMHGRLLCGRVFEGRATVQQRQGKEGPGSCPHSNFMAKSTFFSKLQIAALTFKVMKLRCCFLCRDTANKKS